MTASLWSPFTFDVAVVGNLTAYCIRPAWRLSNRVVLPQAENPADYLTVILHSRADDVVPFADSEELARSGGATLMANIRPETTVFR
jgi:hypothetical protein